MARFRFRMPSSPRRSSNSNTPHITIQTIDLDGHLDGGPRINESRLNIATPTTTTSGGGSGESCCFPRNAFSLPSSPRSARGFKFPTCILSKGSNPDEKQEILGRWLTNSRHELNYIPDYVITDPIGNVNVRIRVHIMSIYNVNTVNQSFDAKLWIQFKWMVFKPYDEIDVSEPGVSEWCPMFEVLNNIGKLTVNTKLHKVARGPLRTDLYCRTVLYGTFAEHFELQRFPIDTERLHVCIVFWQCPMAVKRPHPTREDPPMEIHFPRHVVFYQLPDKNIVYPETFVQRDTWMLGKHVHLRQTKTLAERNDEGVRYPSLDIYAVVTRRVGFYMYNVVTPIFLLVSMSFMSFVVELHALNERLSITLTLLLTLVALKYVVAQYLPATSYLTYLDKYILMSFFFMSITTGQNVLVYWFVKDDVVDGERLPDDGGVARFNRISALLITSTWLMLHVVMCVMLLDPFRARITSNEKDDLEDLEVRYNVPEEIQDTVTDRLSTEDRIDTISICY